MLRHTVWLTLMLLLLAKCSYAQSCNPASVYYIVRDEKGNIVSRADLTAIAKDLPERIGDANISVSEVSFKPDKQTYYWPEDADWEKGTKVPALLFANAATCTMHLGEVTLTYHGKKMSLVFNIDINRTQNDRRQVIDSVRFQPAGFRLDLSGGTHPSNKLIPAVHWKRLGRS